MRRLFSKNGWTELYKICCSYKCDSGASLNLKGEKSDTKFQGKLADPSTDFQDKNKIEQMKQENANKNKTESILKESSDKSKKLHWHGTEVITTD